MSTRRSQIGEPTPTPRRSGRIASVARSNASDVQSQTTTTPRARGRGKAALPGVKARQSNAYGAAGRLGAAEELSVTATGFAQAFESQRETAVARDAVRPSMFQYAMAISDRGSPAPDHLSQSDIASALPNEHADEDLNSIPEEDSPTPSNIDTSKSFGLVHEAGMMRGPPIRPNGFAPAPAPHPPIVLEPEESVEPGPSLLSRILNGAARFKWWLLGALILVSLSLLGHQLACEPSVIGVREALQNRVSDGMHDIADWISSPGAHSSYATSSASSDQYMSRRVNQLEKSLDALKQTLPRDIVLTRNKDGTVDVPEELLRAIASRMASEGLQYGDQTESQDWSHWYKKNKKQIDQWFYTQFDEHSIKVASREETITLLKEHFTKHEKEIEKQIAKAMKAASLSGAYRPNADELRLQGFAETMIAQNIQIMDRTVNFLSPGHGARVIPYYTSSTWTPPELFFKRAWRNMVTTYDRRGPITALDHWNEPGECWCAAPDDRNKGLAQLSIGLAEPIYPKKVTVEHISKDASLSIETAPKEIELWVAANSLAVDALQSSPSAPQCSDGPKGWLCLGKFNYNIHAANNIQTFNMDLDLHSHGPVQKAMVRVTSNWGADHTCIYRVRLHGDRADGA
ncbi:UNC-like C-terminal-domain-containing protein [Lophiotrema nucula]|uniref:UNC-like C-terminal-domain-containing protein n=1 Tax=Lophiotrema nucula TaxID=690887 RepID=A0A6A5ZQD8_9PLEO|nr:UNC-like C-terminal-domain-containing protein [Lophiotrema nucula]